MKIEMMGSGHVRFTPSNDKDRTVISDIFTCSDGEYYRSLDVVNEDGSWVRKETFRDELFLRRDEDGQIAELILL